MPPPESSTHGTPLAPSVEKAYYRKCIELKRRLNEVEGGNDEAKIRRVRLDRGITKMRLERAFLLDELRRRMEHNVDGSEGSGEEGINTPPPDRPHRDKRRRHQPLQPAGAPLQIAPSPHQGQRPELVLHPSYQGERTHPRHHENGTPLVPGPGGINVPANARDPRGAYIYLPPQELAALQHPLPPPPPPPQSYAVQPRAPQLQGSLPGAPVGIPGAAERQINGNLKPDSIPDDGEIAHGPDPPINREAGAIDERLNTAGATTITTPAKENANAGTGTGINNPRIKKQRDSVERWQMKKIQRKDKYGPGVWGRGNRDGIPRGYKHKYYKQACRCIESKPCTCGLREEEEMTEYRASSLSESPLLKVIDEPRALSGSASSAASNDS